MAAEDHELEILLSLDGFEFQFVRGYTVKTAARLAEPTSGRPHGIRYSLTLHDAAGRRIYGLDNAHRVRRGRASGFCGNEVRYEPENRDIQGVPGAHLGCRTR